MPYHDETYAAGFQAFVSSYSIDTLATSFLEVDEISGFFNSTEVPSISPLPLTTTTVDLLMPGIADYYGADLPVDVHFKILSFKNFTVNSNPYMKIQGSMNMQFYVEMPDGTFPMAADIDLDDLTFTFTVAIQNMNLTANISNLNIGSISENSCSFGDLHTLQMKVELNNVFRIIMPSINKFLSKKTVMVPNQIGGLFELSDLYLAYYDNYLYAGATPTFIPPTSQVVTE